MFDNILRFTKSKSYDYFLSSLLIVAITLLIIFYVNLQYLEQFKPVATLEFPESEWIKINDANMHTKIGSGAISPNEQVILVLNVTNKVPLNISIEPEFHTYLAGKLTNVTSTRGAVFGHEHTGTFSESYFPTIVGLNIIKVPLKISYSNGTFLTYQNATTSFDVISTTDELQIQQNDYLFWGVIASAIIGGGTIIALAFSVYFSHKEVEQFESHFRIEKRAMLGATTMMTYDTVSKVLVFPYKNYGTLPAQNIREYHGFRTELFTRNDIETTRRDIAHVSTVFPEQSANYTIGGLHPEVVGKIENKTTPLFIWIEIDFTYSSNIQGKYGVIFELERNTGRFLVREEWMK